MWHHTGQTRRTTTLPANLAGGVPGAGLQSQERDRCVQRGAPGRGTRWYTKGEYGLFNRPPLALRPGTDIYIQKRLGGCGPRVLPGTDGLAHACVYACTHTQTNVHTDFVAIC